MLENPNLRKIPLLSECVYSGIYHSSPNGGFNILMEKKERMKAWREKNKEAISLQQGKWYLLNKEKAKKQSKLWADKNRGRSTFSKQKWKDEHPKARRAHVILNKAVKNGILFRPNNCPQCNRSNHTIHGHHEDYSKPLEVQWMCPQCHKEEEGEINAN